MHIYKIIDVQKVLTIIYNLLSTAILLKAIKRNVTKQLYAYISINRK